VTIDRINDIERVPLAIDYRRMYRAQLYVTVGGRTVGPTSIEFVLEMSPLGTHEVSVNFLDRTDYPTVPAIRMIKERIATLDRDGTLNSVT